MVQILGITVLLGDKADLTSVLKRRLANLAGSFGALETWRTLGGARGRGAVLRRGDGRIIISRLVTNNPTFVAERHRPLPNSLHAVPSRAAATRFKPTSAFNFSMKILPYWHITVQTIQPFES